MTARPPTRPASLKLRTQGYINQRLGDYPRGMSQLLQARGIFESLRIDDGLADVLDGIAGIYYQIGDFPKRSTIVTSSLKSRSASVTAGRRQRLQQPGQRLF